MNQSLIYGDGKNVFFVFQDCYSRKESCSFAYVLKNPIISSVNYSQSIPGPICFLGNGKRLELLNHEPISVEVSMKVLPEQFEVHSRNDGKNVLNGIDVFENLTVSDMFRVINTKLKKREKEK